MSRLLGAAVAFTALLVSACGGATGSDSGATPTASASAASSPAAPAPTVATCKNPDRNPVNQLTTPPAMTIDLAKAYTATVKTSRGTFTIKLDAKAAPKTVNNFVYLAQQHFYDCLTFHRVVPGFVIQGGDPLGNGTGGPAYKLPNETNPAPWNAGSLGMASNSAGVNGSQFFVVLEDAPSLATSGVYNHFGVVTAGMDVVRATQVGDQIISIDATVS